MILHANCKINLGLDILYRREDGFHELSTVMHPIIKLYDEISLEIIEGSNEILFQSTGLVIDCNAKKNLCMRAAHLMQHRYGSERVGGVAITLDKRIPFGAGLGGGSADATAVILGINRLFDLNLSEEELIEIAAELGSDTAFFVRNTPQLCTSRGEVMTPSPVSLEGMWIALIKPCCVSISTREAFAGISPAIPSVPLSERLKEPIEKWQQIIKNDFEPHIFKAHPILSTIKDDLIMAGALYASMSGSGSTVFGIFDSLEHIKGEPLDSYSPLIYQL